MKSLRLLPWCRKLALMETNYAEEEFLIQQGTNRLIGQTNPQNMGKELYSFRWPFDSLGLISNIDYCRYLRHRRQNLSSAKRILRKKLFPSNCVSHEHYFVGASIKELQTNPSFVWGPRSPKNMFGECWGSRGPHELHKTLGAVQTRPDQSTKRPVCLLDFCTV